MTRGLRGRSAEGPLCHCGALGAQALPSWADSPLLPTQKVSWLPWAKSEPGPQLLGTDEKDPGFRLQGPLEPSRRRHWGVQLGQC